MGHHFLSYSRIDGVEMAARVSRALASGTPPVSVWQDTALIAGLHWDDAIVEAIRTCETLLFVMTPDSVASNSVCKQEWLRALKYKRPVLPLLAVSGVELPFLLEPRQYVDLTGDFEAGIDKLRKDLEWLQSPEGQLYLLETRLQDARRDLQRASNETARRHAEADVTELERRIEHQRRVLADVDAAQQEVASRVARGLEEERYLPSPATRVLASTFVNRPPGVAPSYFQDRHVETALLLDFLRDDARRFAFVVGRGGTGKTVMVCRLLKGLETGVLPDEAEPVDVNGVVYLSEAGERPITLPNLLDDVAKLLPRDAAERLQHRFSAAQASAEARIKALLEELPPGGRIVVLLDNFEGFVDPDTLEMRDGELEDGIRAILRVPHGGLKCVVTTRLAPKDILLVEPSRLLRIDLDGGLPSPYAETLLRKMDADGKVGLREAPDELLDRARQQTAGYPRALEALFAILSADRSTSLEELLAETTGLPPDNVVEVLVGEAFSRLSPPSQRVMEALAIYGRPVPAVAVDHLLLPFVPGVNAAPVIGRLVNMHLVRREGGRFFLHPVDRAYALSRVPRGDPGDRPDGGVFTQIALLRRGADWFRQARKPREEWRSFDDLAAPLAEFELRAAAGDFAGAAEILFDIEFEFMIWRGHARQALAMHQQLDGKLSEPRHLLLHAYGYGQTLVIFGPLDAAIDRMQTALRLGRELGDAEVVRGAGGWIGEIHRRLGRLDEAIDYLRTAVAAYDPSAAALDRSCLLELSLACAYRGRTDEAISAAERLQRLADERGDQLSVGQAHDALSLAYLVLGRHDEALSHTRQAIDRYHAAGSPEALGYVSNVRGMALLGLARVDEARQAFEEGLAKARADDNPRLEGFVLFNLAVLYRHQRDVESALRHAQLAVDALARLGAAAENPAAASLAAALRAAAEGDARAEAQALVECAEASIFSADLYPAEGLAREARRLADQVGSRELAVRAEAVLARLDERRASGE